MALTASEYLGTVTPGFVTDDDGRLIVVTTGDSTALGSVIPGFLTDADGRLVVTETTTGADWEMGFMRSPDQELIVTTTTTDADWIDGQWRSPEGYLVVDHPATVTRVNGFMRNATNALAVNGIGINPYADSVLSLDPSILLPLDAEWGLTDISGNSRDGTAGNGITVGGSTPGPLTTDDDGATNFTGTQWVQTTYDPYVNGRATSFMGWAYRDASADGDAIFGSGTTNQIFRLNSGANTVSFFPRASASTTWAWPGNTQWVHWALVFDEPTNNVSLYINGSLVSTQVNADQWTATSGTMRIGVRGGTSEPFDGKMAWFSVHEALLTGPQVLAAYTAGTA